MADVSIYAARREDGALTLIVINLADDEKRVPLEIAGRAPANAAVILLDPNTMRSTWERSPFWKMAR